MVRAILKNNQAIEENLPHFIPKAMRRSMRFIARLAIKRLDHKYAHLLKPGSLVQALLVLRKGLTESSNKYLSGNFSYADISMAVVFELIDPIAYCEPSLGPKTQKLSME